MPTVIADASRAALTDPPRKRWNRSECLALEPFGVWDQHKLELIDGDLIDNAQKKRPHVNALMPLYARLLQLFGPQYVKRWGSR